jgi:uncharacterized protein (UPF0303 family)
MSRYDELITNDFVIGEGKWDQATAIELGEALKKYGEGLEKPIAIAVVFDEQRIYQVGLPGTSKNNDEWIGRKINTVDMTHHSTLALRAKADAMGVKEEDMGFKAGHLAVCGGGFPLYTDGNFVGMAIVSGLPHETDHQILVDVITAFKKGKGWA